MFSSLRIWDPQIVGAPIIVIQLSGDTMTSILAGSLDLSQFPRGSKRCHILRTIKQSLTSVVKLHEAGCKVKFTKWKMGIQIR